jgi:hypothetical protein
MQPGPKSLIGSESLQRPERVKKTFLYRVLGIFVCGYNCSRNRIRTPLMQKNQLTEGFSVALLGSNNQSLLPGRRKVVGQRPAPSEIGRIDNLPFPALLGSGQFAVTAAKFASLGYFHRHNVPILQNVGVLTTCPLSGGLAI